MSETKTRGPADPKRLQRRRFVLKIPVQVSDEVAVAVEEGLPLSACGTAMELFTHVMQAAVDERCAELHETGSELLKQDERREREAQRTKLEKEEREVLAKLQEIRGRRLALGDVEKTDEVTAALTPLDPQPVADTCDECGQRHEPDDDECSYEEDHDEADEPPPSDRPRTRWEQAKERS